MVRTKLTIRVEKIDFDTQASILRLKGRNIEETSVTAIRRYVPAIRRYVPAIGDMYRLPTALIF